MLSTSSHPAVFGSERQFRLISQDRDLIFGGKVARPILGVDKQLRALRIAGYAGIERVDAQDAGVGACRAWTDRGFGQYEVLMICVGRRRIRKYFTPEAAP